MFTLRVCALAALLAVPAAVQADPLLETTVPTLGPVTRLRLPSPADLAVVAADPAQPHVGNHQSSGVSNRDARRVVLTSLYAMSGTVQAYDGFLTMRAVNAGAVEANPLMKTASRDELMMLAVKIGATASTIMGCETLWKDDHRIAAVVVAALANGAMIAVARHNAAVVARLRR